MSSSYRTGLAALLLIATPCAPLLAHRDDYLDETFVFRTLDKGATEIEPALEFDTPRDGPDFWRYRLGVEHGITDHFMIDGFAALDKGGGGRGLGLWRVEARYRFGEENPHGISPAMSLEYEDDRVEGDRRLTPRLVLNRDFASFNITLNLFREFRLAGPEGSAWGYALGLRYGDEDERIRYGVELQNTFGRETRAVIIPQVFLKLREGADMKIGYAQGLTRASDSFVRVMFELEFGGRE